MTPADFEPTEYAIHDGSIRVYRLGVLWYGKLRGERTWIPLADHCLSAWHAMEESLRALGQLDPEPEVETEDELGW